MKKLVSVSLAVIITFTMLFSFSINSIDAKTSGKPTFMLLDVKSEISTLKLKWDKKKVSYYEIYRAKVTKNIKESDYSLDENVYKKLAKVSASKTSYTDKKVKAKQYYAYVIYGYKTSGGKSTKVYSSYLRGMVYEYTGLQTPFIDDSPMESPFNNDANVIYLHVLTSTGAAPQKYIVYRKAASDKKYTKIKVKSRGKMNDTDVFVYEDKKVTSNVKYKYKVKGYRKVGKKKYYSKYSSIYSVTPCNSMAQFDVTPITDAGNTDEIVFKFTSDKNNGSIDILKNGIDEDCSYTFKSSSDGETMRFLADFIGCSDDNSLWQEKTKVRITPGQTIYLKFKLKNEEGKTTPITFGAATGEMSELNSTSVKYHGPNFGSTNLRIDFVEGKAYASQAEDDY